MERQGLGSIFRATERHRVSKQSRDVETLTVPTTQCVYCRCVRRLGEAAGGGAAGVVAAAVRVAALAADGGGCGGSAGQPDVRAAAGEAVALLYATYGLADLDGGSAENSGYTRCGSAMEEEQGPREDSSLSSSCGVCSGRRAARRARQTIVSCEGFVNKGSICPASAHSCHA